MRRYFTETLLGWKAQKTRKPLIVRGARQIGKSYTIESFAKENFEHVAVFNFEKQPQLVKIFDDDLSAPKLIERLELVLKRRIEDAATLLFFDEIQKCPRAITALRYFYEERPHLAVIAAGSLIEFALAEISVPVGRVSYATMFPMSFKEFLLALGEELLVDHMTRELPTKTDVIHKKLLDLVRTYTMVGGMPEAVATYVLERSVIAAQKVHGELIESYKQDFSKYARQSRHPHLLKVLERLPQLVGRQVKFVMIDRETSAANLSEAIRILERAHILHRVRSASGSGLPLSSHASDKYFKLVFVDIGLFQSLANIDWANIPQDADLVSVYEGALAEQFVGQELLACGDPQQHQELFYWRNEALNAAAEIDYLIHREGQVCPIEVKAGKKGRLRSMSVFREKFSPRKSFVISSKPCAENDGIEWLPLYAVERVSHPVCHNF